MSKTTLSTAVDVAVKVASHFSKVPSIGTEAFTANLIVLLTGVTLKTGTPAVSCAGINGKGETNARKQVKAIRTAANLGFFPLLIINVIPFCFSFVGDNSPTSARYLFLFGRIILQQLCHGFVQILLVLFLVRAGINGLSRISSPDQ